MDDFFRVLSQLLVRWVKSNVLPKFGPATDLIETDIEELLHVIHSAYDGYDTSAEVYLCAIEYLRRLHSVSPHSISLRYSLIVAVSLGIKFHEDHPYSLKQLAFVCNLKVTDLVQMERDFLKIVCYNVFVSLEQYQFLRESIEREYEYLRIVRELSRACQPPRISLDPFAPLPYTFLEPSSMYQQPLHHVVPMQVTSQEDMPMSSWHMLGLNPHQFQPQLESPPQPQAQSYQLPQEIQPFVLPHPSHDHFMLTSPDFPPPRTTDWFDLIDDSSVDFSLWDRAILPHHTK